MNITVAKFGGTSMGDYSSISEVAEIVEGIDGERVVVVSATSGTTDQLIQLGNEALENGKWESGYT